MDIYVGNLPFQTTEDDLTEAFSAHGNVDRVKLITDRETGRSRGFAFVTMNEAGEASAAIEALNEQDFQGRPLRVREAEDRRPPRREGGGGGGRGRDGGGYGGGGGGGYGGGRGGDRGGRGRDGGGGGYGRDGGGRGGDRY